MGEPMTEAEARERLVDHVAARIEQTSVTEDACFAVAAILATTDALAVLLDWHELGKRATPEQLTKALRGAEEAGRATSDFPARRPDEGSCWRRWFVQQRIVPDEEGAT